ncbi:unnamed protein product [Fusarium graminearum]|uniref:C2H2-type domain-containing protein n=1 Tax=Gibberella zeae TaxID=5518 RepID=A0A9N8RC88_GIBZA|nr:unnamed protein product [Fusarium graminearum]
MFSRPPVSSAAKQAVKAAFEQLEKAILPEDACDFTTKKLDDVRKAALALENQLAARKALRNMSRLLPLLTGLEHYAKVMDILCNGTPFLSWIWAPITLITRIASEYIEAFEKIIKGYARIADCLGRFKTLHTALGAERDFQETLAVFYVNILQYHEQAYTFVRRKGWKVLFLTSWGRFERRFDNILDDMKRHEKLVDLQASVHGISDVRQLRDDIKSWREESRAQIHKWHEKQAIKQYDSIVSWLKSEESDQLAIFDAISSEGAKFAGTCSWVLSNSRIKAWLGRATDPSVLWLQGTPGSGKSVLVSQVVKFMKTSKMLLVYHFCSHRYASSREYEQILRSIILQLLRKFDELIAHVYEDCILAKRSPTIQSLEKLLYSLFSIASKGPRQSEYIWIIIDGLNECDPRTQSSVANLINQITNRLSGSGDTVCKFLVSSRKTTHIVNRLRMRQTVSLTEERDNVKLAIRQYVSQRLRGMHEMLAQLDLTRKDIDDVERVITNKADGMFLYARLVLDYLSKNIFYTGSEMRRSIDELPEKLSEFYRQILVQILVQLDERSVQRIKNILGWIAFAKRPMKRMEFLSALAFSNGEFKVTSLVPKYILDICGALVEERSDTTMTFIHISVKEFLQSPASNVVISEGEALTEHCLSALACLICGSDIFLTDKDYHEKASRVVKGIHGFHVYATEFWTEYVLHYFSTQPPSDNSIVLNLATKLAERLGERPDTEDAQNNSSPSPPVDERLKHLKDWPRLINLVEASLRSRSLKRLESNLVQELQHSTGIGDETKLGAREANTLSPDKHRLGRSTMQETNDISRMLSSYQEVVRFLLQQDEYPGISAADLYLFKSQFQSSAFTCRLSFCPRATNGFSSEELRRQHEIAHTQLSLCTVPECRYPPFTSIKALKAHINKYHRPEKRTRHIRRNGSVSLRQRYLDAGVEPSVERLAHRGKSAELSGIKHNSSPTSRSTATALRRIRVENSSNSTETPGQTKEGRRLSVSSQAMDMDDDNNVFNLDEILQVPIASIGFRGCTIANCGYPFGAWSEEYCDDNDTDNVVSYHYWNWHHADSMAQCAVTGCQMIFSSGQGLKAHYKKRHTALFCTSCDEHYPDGFALEDELRNHWRSNHLMIGEGWICNDPSDAMPDCPPTTSYSSCSSCTQHRRFGRREDAITHLETQHFPPPSHSTDETLTHFLEPYVRRVWAYEVVKREEVPRYTQGWTFTMEGSDEEEEEALNNTLYFIKDLA